MRSTPKPVRLGTAKEAAEVGRCSTKTIRRMISSGQITGYRFGSRMIRVDLNELESMLRPIGGDSSAA